MQKLAEICIRRPVFATMLIMALVVLGLDVVPQTRRRPVPEDRFPGRHHHHHAARRRAGRSGNAGHRSASKKPSTRSAASTSCAPISAEGVSHGHHRVRARQGPRSRRRRKSATRCPASFRSCPRDVDPPVVEKLATDASPIFNVVVSSPPRPARDHQDRRRPHQEEHRVAEGRRPGPLRRRPAAPDPGLARRREAVRLQPERRAGARRRSRRRTSKFPAGAWTRARAKSALRTLGRARPDPRTSTASSSATPAAPRCASATSATWWTASKSRARWPGWTAQPAVVLEIRKQSGTNTLDVIKRVKERIAELQKTLPPDFQHHLHARPVHLHLRVLQGGAGAPDHGRPVRRRHRASCSSAAGAPR